MKKILLCGILAMAAGTMAFAQQWPDGFSVSGQLRTGLRGDFLGGEFYDSKKGLDQKASDEKSSFWFWHDDSGNRAQLNMSYTQENFGFRLVPRWAWAPDGSNLDRFVGQLPAAYGWFELFNDMVRVTAGKIDDAVWASPTPIDLSFDSPIGLRIEVKPIEGLSVGWAIGDNATGMSGFPGQGSSNNILAFNPGDLFGSSAFGAKYANDMFTFAAGLELIHDRRNRRTMEDGFEFGGKGNPVTEALNNGISGGIDLTEIGDGTVGTGKTGVSAYAGVEVKPVDGLTVQVGANAGNLDATKDYGYIHLNEYLAYDLDGITPRVELHQKMDISDNKYTMIGATSAKSLPVYMKFIPGVDIGVADNLNAYVDIPVAIWDKVFEVGVKPGVDYTFGPGLSIGCYYNFILTTNSYDTAAANGGKYKDKTAIRNAVQINFGWSF